MSFHSFRIEKERKTASDLCNVESLYHPYDLDFPTSNGHPRCHHTTRLLFEVAMKSSKNDPIFRSLDMGQNACVICTVSEESMKSDENTKFRASIESATYLPTTT